MPPVDKQSGGGTSAYDELVQKAEQLRAQNPSLTKEAAFSKVFSDPENSALAQAERAENRPSASATW